MFEANAPAKVNLYLKVFEKRPDGFHAMETVMLKVGLMDHLRLRIEDGQGISLHIENSPELEAQDNLIVRAAKLLLETAGMEKKLHFSLTKRIFLSAGLGGGSSDAAATLVMLNKALGGPLSFDQLLQLAGQLGSDVPFFVYDTSLGFAHGRGEQIIPWVALPSKPVLLVNPGFGMSTAKVYQKLARPSTWNRGKSHLLEQKAPQSWRELESLVEYQNDFQSVAEEEFPIIAKVRGLLLSSGARMSMLSGSGSTVFGLFESQTQAQEALGLIKNNGFRAVLTSSL